MWCHLIKFNRKLLQDIYEHYSSVTCARLFCPRFLIVLLCQDSWIKIKSSQKFLQVLTVWDLFQIMFFILKMQIKTMLIIYSILVNYNSSKESNSSFQIFHFQFKNSLNYDLLHLFPFLQSWIRVNNELIIQLNFPSTCPYHVSNSNKSQTRTRLTEIALRRSINPSLFKQSQTKNLK